MGLYLLDYGAGNVASLANSLKSLGHDFQWISSKDDFARATKLLFPGVGAFKSAIEHLQSRGLLDPLKEYIESGRPYFGICIGMQVLFTSSTENSSVQGLGIIPTPIEQFDNTSKSVPHMGWNAVEFINTGKPIQEGLDESEHYYFVHSYRAAYDPENNPAAAQWVHSTCQYGREVFVASVRGGNIFGTQFHPEKSGVAGLRILDTWVRQSLNDNHAVVKLSKPLLVRRPRPRDQFTKRIIACMDVRANDEGDLVVTKGDQYEVREKTLASASAPSARRPNSPNGEIRNGDLQVLTAGAVRNLGKPVSLAAKYYAAGADELCLLNITSFRHSPLQDQPMLAVVRAAAENIFVPLTIGGGIKDTPQGGSALDVAGAYFRAGADKVSIGSEAVYAVERLLRNNGDPDGSSAIEAIADAYGKQAVVVSIDPKRVYVDNLELYDGPFKDEFVYGRKGTEDEGKVWWYRCTASGGRVSRDLSVVQLAKGAETLGAGEILLNSIDRDGTGKGFDLDLIRLVRNAVRIPVVASSGAGIASHFPEVFQQTCCEAALAAGIFHRGDVKIEDVKQAMKSAGIETR